jgi:methylated-DNA-[protein]-cysteine S-methyltransferase
MDQKLDDRILVKCIESPFGHITITTNETHLLQLNFSKGHEEKSPISTLPIIMTETLTQLDLYFKKTLSEFDIPINPNGTDFQKNVWKTLQSVTFGNVLTYQNLAEQIESISKTRAVASAIAKNPILIIIPCHRIIGSNGKLTGYSGGIDRKRQLLIHENRNKFDKTLLF